MSKLKRVWVSEDAYRSLKIDAAERNKSIKDAFDDLVKDSKKSKGKNWGGLF